MENYRSKYWRATPLRKQYAAGHQQCRRVGTAHATGDALRAMYASLVAFHHNFHEKFAPLFFLELLKEDGDEAVSAKAREWMRDSVAASGVAFGRLDEVTV